MPNIQKSDDQWKAELTEEQYRVLRQKGTERPFSGEYNDTTEEGMYVCAGCGTQLFESDSKYDAGCGWPSFTDAVEGKVEEAEDTSHGMHRTEVLCKECGGHLGHVFPDGPGPTGNRYCINSAALKLKKD